MHGNRVHERVWAPGQCLARAPWRQVKENFGDLIAYCHNYLGKAFDPEEDESDDLEDPGLPFFEGPRMLRTLLLLP